MTIPQIAPAVGVTSHGISPLIRRGRIGVTRDEETGLSLLPDRPETLEAFRQLRDGQITETGREGVPCPRRAAAASGRKLAWLPGQQH